jgi:hypothetical protein
VKDTKEKPKQRGKSILKKNSILSKESVDKSSVVLEKGEEPKDVPVVAKKTKKSVMFTKSRFAD